MKKIIKSRDEEERKKLASEKKTEEGRKQERNEKRKKKKELGSQGSKRYAKVHRRASRGDAWRESQGAHARTPWLAPLAVSCLTIGLWRLCDTRICRHTYLQVYTYYIAVSQRCSQSVELDT